MSKTHVSRDDLDTAWSIDLVMKSAICLLLVAVAPLVAAFFEREALTMALRVGCLVLLFNALRSARVNILKQELNYGGIFRLSVLQRLVAFGLVVALAVVLNSFWAMIIADVLASLFFMLGSYVIAPHGPRFTLVNARQQWGFSSWMLIRGVVGYTRSQIDTLFASKLYSTTILGNYHVARDLAMMPAHNLVVPATEPLLAVYRHSRGDGVRKALVVVSLFTFPMAAFLAAFSSSLIAVLLGPQWEQAAPLLRIMTLLLAYFSFSQVFEKVLIVAGRVRLLFLFEAFGLLLVTTALITARDSSPEGIALVRGLAGVVNLLLIILAARATLELRSFLPLASMAQILFCTGIAYWGSLVATASTVHPLAQIVLGGMTFGIGYVAALALLTVTPWTSTDLRSLRHFLLARVRR